MAMATTAAPLISRAGWSLPTSTRRRSASSPSSSSTRRLLVRAVDAVGTGTPSTQPTTQPKQRGSTRFIPSTGPSDWGDANRLVYRKPEGVSRVTAPAGAPPIVILPGFGNNTGDYVAPFGVAEVSIKAALEARGWFVHVVELERKDWLNILRAVLSVGFWTGKSTTHPGYTWYLARVDEAVKRAMEASGSDRVDIVAHSAGGWLARAYMGGALEGAANAGARGIGGAQLARTVVAVPVRRLVTLGAPHIEPPQGANDATRGALKWVNKQWPGAHFRDDEVVGSIPGVAGVAAVGGVLGVTYTCVTGRTVRGKAAPEAQGTIAGYASNSYKEVCGVGDEVEGDAVVPNDFAVLQGADNLIVDGVFHSMSQVGTYETAGRDVWYGSEEVVDIWLGALVR